MAVRIFLGADLQPVAVRVRDEVNAHGFVLKADASHLLVELVSLLEIVRVESQVEFHAFVKPEEVLDEMHKSSVVLVLNNLQKEKRYFGIMTTKFFEAIGANRPVLSIPDNHDNLSQLVRETGCGLASSDVREIGQFLIEKHAEWKRQGYVCGTVDEAVRMDYSRRKGAEMLVELIMNYAVHNK